MTLDFRRFQVVSLGLRTSGGKLRVTLLEINSTTPTQSFGLE